MLDKREVKLSGNENCHNCDNDRSWYSKRIYPAQEKEEITIILCIFMLVGAAGIGYTVHALLKLDDFFDEVYIYDRDPYT